MSATEQQLIHLGKTIEGLFETVLNHIHDCDKCGRTFLPPDHPHCQSCESSSMLIQCHGCKEWFCKTGCAQMHPCGSGPEPTEGRF